METSIELGKENKNFAVEKNETMKKNVEKKQTMNKLIKKLRVLNLYS